MIRPMTPKRAWAWAVPWLLAGLALFASILFHIPLGDGSVEGGGFSPSGVIGFGVLAGLVLTERWTAESRTALTSRETMRELR
jgi:hypothetical protein